jgi:uncharacterized membrane protein YhdT
MIRFRPAVADNPKLKRLIEELEKYEKQIADPISYFRNALFILSRTILVHVALIGTIVMAILMFVSNNPATDFPISFQMSIISRQLLFSIFARVMLVMAMILLPLGRLQLSRLEDYLQPEHYVPRLRKEIARFQRRLP